MADTLYFYDLETSGISSREDRIMQFAGQRTSLDLEPMGDPDNILIKMTDDTLPSPDAILITGITPQQTIADGISEQEFCKYFTQSIATPHTTMLGYNTLRFDNEFMRFTLYRNFYDAYEWSYASGRSVWDMLDVVRMMRALRPDGIEWPFAPDGKPTNSLEKLTAVNKIDHANAHDALADVNATIAVARLIKRHQPKLFNYLFTLRNKQEVMRLVGSGKPFVYTSGRYNADFHKTTAATVLADHPVYGSSKVLVYDLRHDPAEFINLSAKELAERLEYVPSGQEAPPRLPVKALTYNKCPAVAPLAVLTDDARQRIAIDMNQLRHNEQALKSDPTFTQRVIQAFNEREKTYQPALIGGDLQMVDTQLYDGFLNDADKRLTRQVPGLSANDLVDYHPNFNDERLSPLLLLYKARQFKNSLSADEQREWEQYRRIRLLGGETNSRMAKYFARLEAIANDERYQSKKDILQDLWLWGESIMPEPYE